MSEYTVRRAVPEDAAEICRMIDCLNRQENMPEGATTPEVVREHGFGDDPSFTVFVAEGKEGVCGYTLVCLRIFNTEYAMRGGYMMDLWVDEAARGSGVAENLVAAACALVKEDGGQFLEWFSTFENDRGKRFYEKIGSQRDSLFAHALHPAEFSAMADLGKGHL